MPEIVEVEIYRRQAEVIVSRSVVGVVAPDHWYLKGATTERSLSAAVLNRKVRAVRRVGKVLLVDFDPDDSRDQLGAVLGLRFGMTGRLVVDGQASIEKLLYSTSVSRPRYRRFELIFERGRSLVMVDPRRLGGVELAPDERRLGPDAATITARRLGDALRGSAVAVKARLLDQHRLAGIGNLIADETLWRVGIDPTRPSQSLNEPEVKALAAAIRATIRLLQRRGGSHLGDLQEERHREGRCPHDGAKLRRDVLGGRTTYWCPEHQG